MTINEKREHLKMLYGEVWKKKVEKMSDNQILAVYLRLAPSMKFKGAR